METVRIHLLSTIIFYIRDHSVETVSTYPAHAEISEYNGYTAEQKFRGVSRAENGALKDEFTQPIVVLI